MAGTGSTAVTTMSAEELLGTLILAGFLGMVGQGARAIVGLKKMNDEAQASGASAQDLFIASRLVVSLIVGFIAGVIAAFCLGISKLLSIKDDDTQLMLGIAAAGYAGTDFIEAFARKLGSSPQKRTGGDLGGATAAGGKVTRRTKPNRQGARSRLQRNQLEAYQAARADGLRDVAATALVANMTGESLAHPDDYHWDVSHYAQGIVQWDPTRSEAIKNQFGKYPMYMTVAEQTKAAIWEIQTNTRFAPSKRALTSGQTAKEIIDVLVRNYEVPAHPDTQVNIRIGYLSDVSKLIDASPTLEA